jgi:hypothetical protein
MSMNARTIYLNHLGALPLPLPQDFVIARRFMTLVLRVGGEKIPRPCRQLSRWWLLPRVSVTESRSTESTTLMIDRVPADNVNPNDDSEARTSSLTSLSSSASNLSFRSSTPSQRKQLGIERFNAIIGSMGAGTVPACDRVFVPVRGQRDNLDGMLAKEFGTYDVLCTLTINDTHKQMSLPELATLLKVVHSIAPNYTAGKYQCYWFSAIVYLVIEKQTGGINVPGPEYHKKGKLFSISPPICHRDTLEIADDEYRIAKKKLEGILT